MPGTSSRPTPALFLTLFLFTGCSPGSDGGPRPAAGTPYLLASAFFEPLPPDPPVDAQSQAFIADLLLAKNKGRFNLNLDEYNVAVVRPPPGTQRVDVTLTQAASKSLPGVPLPEGAQPAPGTDAHLVILDEQGGASFEFWQARRVAGRWQASTGVAYDLAGDGINRAGSGVRATSLSLLLGLITHEEITGGGPIRHALAWAYDRPNSGYYVPPAASGDGKTRGRPGGIPQGARLQLDPALDLDTLGLSPAGRRLAEAMQRYGLFLVDTSSDSSLYGEALPANDPGGRTWKGALAWDELAKVPVERLRVLRLPDRVPF